MTETVPPPVTPQTRGRLETSLRGARDAGRKLLVPYVTGGLAGWIDVVRALADAGADAIEIGVPFSDPVMDGPTIQEASERALANGVTKDEIGELITHLAFYSGWPSAMSAAKVVKQVFEEKKA